uniref:Uncharacterized protein n=1 Tax=Lotus japonicus TaxID=34305 RepID=I3S4I0_LOTJA|nr:unknown [Lotus japonicus]
MPTGVSTHFKAESLRSKSD